MEPSTSRCVKGYRSTSTLLIHLVIMAGFTTVLVTCLISSVFAYPHQPNSEDAKLGIIGGHIAVDAEFPYIINIMERYNTSTTVWFCQGVILTENWILTAGRCQDLDSSNGTRLKVVAGRSRETVQEVAVKKVYRHPNYTRTAAGVSENNIALIKLETPLKLNKYVQGIGLPDQGYIPVGEGEMIGWGIANKKLPQNETNNLLAIRANIMPVKECKKILPYINEHHVCPKEFGALTCVGRNGSPFVQTIGGVEQVIAIQTDANSDCDNGDAVLEVHTSVSAYMDDFIVPIMRHN